MSSLNMSGIVSNGLIVIVVKGKLKQNFSYDWHAVSLHSTKMLQQ